MVLLGFSPPFLWYSSILRGGADVNKKGDKILDREVNHKLCKELGFRATQVGGEECNKRYTGGKKMGVGANQKELY